MLKNRLIPCLITRDGMLVKSIKFSRYQIIGNPKTAAQFFNAWAVDELILLNISPGGTFSLGRSDKNDERVGSFLEIITDVSRYCFVPLTVGGGIRSVDDMYQYLQRGADKIAINTQAFRDPTLITLGADKFGSQCIVVSIDVKKKEDGAYEVYIAGGKEATGWDPVRWACKAEACGAGEIFLNSIDRDGTLAGYDLELLKSVVQAVKIPVIACGGVGKWDNLVEGITQGQVAAVAAANIFYFTEQSTKKAKARMREAGLAVRDEGASVDTRVVRRNE